MLLKSNKERCWSSRLRSMPNISLAWYHPGVPWVFVRGIFLLSKDFAVGSFDLATTLPESSVGGLLFCLMCAPLIFRFRLSAILSWLDYTMLWYGTQSRQKLVFSIPMMLPPNSAAQCFISVLGNSLAQCFVFVLWDNMFIPWYGTQSWQIFVFHLFLWLSVSSFSLGITCSSPELPVLNLRRTFSSVITFVAVFF